MYKKVYIEITNNCNLSCDFCPHNKRKNEFITLDNFNIILDKLENYTKYLYLHAIKIRMRNLNRKVKHLLKRT